MSKIQTIVGLLLFLIILFSMNMIFGNVLKESFTQNIKISSPNKNNKNNTNDTNNKNNKNNTNDTNDKQKYSRLLTQNQNDDQPLFFGFS